MSYQIIYLNGASSSGKSQFVKALQQAFEQPLLHVGIDKVIGMMPEKLNDWQGGKAPLGFSWRAVKDGEGTTMQELQMGPFAKRIHEAYREIVLTFAKLNHFIVIDDVAFGKRDVNEWKRVLSAYKVLYVGLHAPLEVIEKRERERGDRMIGSARAQFRKVHDGIVYDLELDTYHATEDENVKKILSLF